MPKNLNNEEKKFVDHPVLFYIAVSFFVVSLVLILVGVILPARKSQNQLSQTQNNVPATNSADNSVGKYFDTGSSFTSTSASEFLKSDPFAEKCAGQGVDGQTVSSNTVCLH